MNPRNAFVPILGVLVSLAGLFVIASVLLGSGNQLAALCRYLLVAGFVAGFMFPRGGLMFWLALCGYTDLLKRLMVVFGRIEYSDLYNVLGIPPVMLGGITLAVLVGAFTGRFQLQGHHWKLLGLACVLMLASAAMAAKQTGGSLGAIAPAIANDGLYAMLLFVVPVLFQNSDDVVRLMKHLLWAYLPVLAYGIFQKVNGFQDFEIAYLKTGLSIEIKQLVAEEVRAFSTLNSPTSFSIVCAALATMSLVFGFTPKADGTGRLMARRWAVLLSALYVTGIFASTSRTAFLFIMAAGAGFLAFRSRAATRLLYAGMGTAFLTLVFTADVLLANLDAWQMRITEMTGGSNFATEMSRVGSYSDRLRGLSNLARNPEVYTLFGHGPERGSDPSDPLYAHDLLSNILVTHGLVPLLLLAGLAAMVLVHVHGRIQRLGDMHHRLLAAGLLGLVFSFFAISLVSGSVLTIFPVNMCLWFCAAALMLTFQSEAALAEPQAVPEDEPPSLTARPVHRFRRSGI